MIDTRIFDSYDEAEQFAIETANFNNYYVTLMKLNSDRYIAYVFDYQPIHMYSDEYEVFLPYEY